MTENQCSPPQLQRAASVDSLDSNGSTLDDRLNDEDSPQLQIELSYERSDQILQVNIIQLCDLQVLEGRVWIIVFLLPHPKPLWRTEFQLVNGLFAVQFQQTYRQCVRQQDLTKIALMCQLYGENASNIVNLIGQCRLRLKDVSLAAGRTNDYWLTLSSPVLQDLSQVTNAGEILFSLSFMQDRLLVIISRLRQLPETVQSALVRMYLVQSGGGSKVIKKKTGIRNLVNGTIDFNESLIISITRTKLEKSHLRFSIVQVEKDNQRCSIGHVTIGNRRSGKEFGHWQRLQQCPQLPTSMWHKIIAKQMPSTGYST